MFQKYFNFLFKEILNLFDNSVNTLNYEQNTSMFYAHNILIVNAIMTFVS